MEEEKNESGDMMTHVPEAMRGMFKKMMDDQIQAQVDAQVKEKMATMQQEMDKLKKDLQEAVKNQATAPKTPNPKKVFGISRPSTALAPKNGADKNGSTLQTPRTNLKTTPKLKTPTTSRDKI